MQWINDLVESELPEKDIHVYKLANLVKFGTC